MLTENERKTIEFWRADDSIPSQAFHDLVGIIGRIITDEAVLVRAEEILRGLNVCEVRLWREPWYRASDGMEVGVTIKVQGDSGERYWITLAEAVALLRGEGG